MFRDNLPTRGAYTGFNSQLADNALQQAVLMAGTHQRRLLADASTNFEVFALYRTQEQGFSVCCLEQTRTKYDCPHPNWPSRLNVDYVPVEETKAQPYETDLRSLNWNTPCVCKYVSGSQQHR